MFAPIFWDRGDGITPTLSLYLPEINPHNNPIVGAANMQEMPRFSKAPRPPDGFIKGAYWPGACLLPIARPGDGMLGIFPNFPVLGKLIRQAREMSRFGEKLGIFPNIPHVGILIRRPWEMLRNVGKHPISCQQYHRLLLSSGFFKLPQKIFRSQCWQCWKRRRRSRKFYVSAEENRYPLPARSDRSIVGIVTLLPAPANPHLRQNTFPDTEAKYAYSEFSSLNCDPTH